MKALWGKVAALFSKPVNFFACTDPQDEQRCFGLGQFVVLLTLTPFVLTSTLFSLVPPHKVVSSYQYDVARFPGFVDLPPPLPEPQPMAPEMAQQVTQCQQLMATLGVTAGRLPPPFSTTCIVAEDALAIQTRKVEEYKQRRADRDNVLDPEHHKIARTTPPGDQIYTERRIDSMFDPMDGRPATFFAALALLPVRLSTLDMSAKELEEAYTNCRFPDMYALMRGQPAPDCSGLKVKLEAKNLEEAWRARNPGYLTRQTAFDPTQSDAQPRDNLEVLLGQQGRSFVNSHKLVLLMALLLYLPTVWLCVKRRHFGMLVFGLVVLHVGVVAFALELAGVRWAQHPWLWVLLPKVAFIWFAAQAKIRSKSFGLYVLLIAGLALVHGQQDNNSLWLSLLTVLAFVLAMALTRLLLQGCWENAYLLRNLGWLRSLRVAARSLVLWLPMALLAVPYFVLTEHVIPKALVTELHENKTLLYPYGHDLRDNLLQSTADYFDERVFRLHMATEKLKRDVIDQAAMLRTNGLEARLMKEFETIMPPNLTFAAIKTDVPVIGGALDSGAEKVQTSVNDAYKNLRTEIEGTLRAFAQAKDKELREDVVNPGEKTALNALRRVKDEGTDLMARANRDTQDSIWWTSAYLRVAHQLALLLFAVVCVKSFLYVFARISFHSDTGTFLTVGQSQGANHEASQAQITPTGQQYIFPGGIEETFYVSRRFQCRGKAPKFSLPQPMHAPIARLMHGAMTMNKLALSPGDGAVNCTATRGAEFLEWDLRAGEVVLFNFHHFVGMSESVQISTVISPRISTLLLGRFIFSAATGPGKLILMTEGRAEVTQDHGVAQSLPPERLVAMHQNTRLHVESELGFVDIYLSTAYIRPAGAGRVIVDVDSQRGDTMGLVRFFKNFLWPA